MTEMMTMTAARPAAPDKNTDKKDCHCGCGTGGDCCDLECLVHPRFFCGQLLADQDLTALVDWVKAKSALARYRHGWGVVCGLDVHCGKRGTITVSPGYAMDCCGRDIVVCQETPFDLAPCWQRPDDPCANGTAAAASRVFMNGQGGPANNQFGFIPRNELQAVDVFIRYAESQTDSRTALARGGCGGTGGCEYTRVHEGCDIYCKPAEDECEVPADPWVAWQSGYVTGLSDLRRDLAGIVRQGSAERMLEYVTRNPPHSFCFIREWLCWLAGQQNGQHDADLQEIALWILQDWRNHYLQKPCRGCGPDTGIRLARVWIWMRRDSRGKETLSTVYVNAYPPFRRALAGDDWPAPPDKVNLGPYVWQPFEAAMQSMRRARLSATPAEATFAALPEQEIIFANAEPNADQAPLTVYWAFDPHCRDQKRVVGFGNHAAPPPPAQPNTPPPPPVAEPAPAGPRIVNLTDINGIGDGIATRLRAAGINTVADLANASPETVRGALGNLPVSDARLEEIRAQARAAVSQT